MKGYNENLFPENESLKCVVLGDIGVGKSTLLITYSNQECPKEYLPMVADYPELTITLTAEKANERKVHNEPQQNEKNKPKQKLVKEDQKFNLALWDTGGGENYQHIRPLSYPHTDVVLICFDIANEKSFERVRNYYKPEIAFHMPNTPWLLIGNKSDLRPGVGRMPTELSLKTPTKTPYKSPAEKENAERVFISKERAEVEAASLNAAKYLECSSYLLNGVNEVFLEAVKVAAEALPVKERRKRKCQLL